MITKPIIFIILFVLVISFASAKTDYNESGHFDNLYATGVGIFDSELTTDIITPKILTASFGIPLVSDLDNDGTNEIIIFDDDSVILYQTSLLNQLALLDSIGISGRTSNAIVFDIDNDGLSEIIFAEEETELLHFLTWNGTFFSNTTTLKLDTIEHGDGEMMVKCGEINSCLLVVSTNASSQESCSGACNGRIFVHGFNKTYISTGTLIDGTTGSADNFCFSNNRHILYIDYDSDGTTEYIFNAIEPARASNDDVFAIYFVSLNSSLGANIDMTQIDVTTDEPVETANPISCVTHEMGKYFSSPLVFDLNAPSSTPEIMMAYLNAPNKFALHAWKSSGSFLDSFPAACRPLFLWTNCATADSVSPLLRMDVFQGNENVDDVCVIGYNNPGEELDIICGSKTSTHSLSETLEITMDTPHNLTLSYMNQNTIAHVGDYIEEFTSGSGGLKDIPELITSYGVLKISRTALSTASIEFPNPQDDTILIPVDVEKTNSEDFILLASSNVFYLDDGVSNLPAIITNVTFNPCPTGNAILKVNTTMDIFVIVTDQNHAVLGQDTVNSKVTIYEGSTNEFNESTSAVVSGAIQPYQFTLNNTITNGNIKIEGWDTANPSIIDTIDTTFNVNNFGVEYGDTSCSLEIVTAAEVAAAVITEPTLTEDITDNAIATGIIETGRPLGLGGTTTWLFIMIIATLGIWWQMAKFGLGGNAALGMIVIFNFLMIILGARLAILSTSLIVIIIVVSVVIIGIFLGRFLTGLSSQT